MNRLTGFRILAAAAAFAAAGPACADGTGRWSSAQELYSKVCARCHETQVAPVLTGRQLAPELIKTIVRAGNRAMPAFRESEIGDEALSRVAEFVSAAPGASR